MSLKIKLASIIAIFAILISFNIPKRVMAQSDEFFIDSNVEYIFLDNGISRVKHHISIENKLATLYAKSFTLDIKGLSPKNIYTTDIEGVSLVSEISTENDQTTIKILLPDSKAGKGSGSSFYINYETSELSSKAGEVWEISIPKTQNISTYRNYQLTLSVPQSYGSKAYINPSPVNEYNSGNNLIFTFTKDQIKDVGINAAFGQFQVYSFVLNYHLENPLNSKAKTEITIPPDTPYQKVYIEQIEPKPERIYGDTNGNWLAEYFLEPRKKVDIQVRGTVQLFSTPWRSFEFSEEYVSQNLTDNDIWPAKNSEIIKASSGLKNARDVYDYVVNKLTYDYSRVKPNTERLGALSALKNPTNAICLEFTDLFIALSRSIGIPAREVNGYAYSENPEIQPLSLVADVLHAWPEYWDFNKKIWIPVDPTWGSTTGGLNYFDKLDLRHFSFVFHGSDPTKPYPPGSYKLGVNPQKDVFVNFGKLPSSKKPSVEFHTKLKHNYLKLTSNLIITVKNTGTSAIYNEPITVYLDNKLIYKEEIKNLLPYSEQIIEFPIPSELFDFKNDQNITISMVGISKDVQINDYIYLLILISVVLFIILIIVIFIFVKHKKQQILKAIINEKNIDQQIK